MSGRATAVLLSGVRNVATTERNKGKGKKEKRKIIKEEQRNKQKK